MHLINTDFAGAVIADEASHQPNKAPGTVAIFNDENGGGTEYEAASPALPTSALP
jgi:hypothetical protein